MFGHNYTGGTINYRKQAQELWFSGGSCTGGKPE